MLTTYPDRELSKHLPRLKKSNFATIGKVIDHLSMVGGINTHDSIQPLNPDSGAHHCSSSAKTRGFHGGRFPIRA